MTPPAAPATAATATAAPTTRGAGDPGSAAGPGGPGGPDGPGGSGGAAGGGGRPGARRSRRWLRGVVPFAVVLVLMLGSGVTWWIDHFSPSDAAFLSPVSSEPAGARTLAQRLADRGVSVHRYTHSRDALRAADGGDATLFVPAPEYVWPGYLEAFSQLDTTVVLVMPGRSTIDAVGLPVVEAGQRFATGLAAPDCDHPVARTAGPATVLRQRYAAGKPAKGQPGLAYRCYGGALVTASLDHTRFEDRKSVV